MLSPGCSQSSETKFGSTGLRRRFRRRSGRLWRRARWSSTGSWSEEGSRTPWCKAKSGSTGSGEGSSAWLRSALQKDLQKQNVAAAGDATEAYFFLNIYYVSMCVCVYLCKVHNVVWCDVMRLDASWCNVLGWCGVVLCSVVLCSFWVRTHVLFVIACYVTYGHVLLNVNFCCDFPFCM